MITRVNPSHKEVPLFSPASSDSFQLLQWQKEEKWLRCVIIQTDLSGNQTFWEHPRSLLKCYHFHLNCVFTGIFEPYLGNNTLLSLSALMNEGKNPIVSSHWQQISVVSQIYVCHFTREPSRKIRTLCDSLCRYKSIINLVWKLSFWPSLITTNVDISISLGNVSYLCLSPQMNVVWDLWWAAPVGSNCTSEV